MSAPPDEGAASAAMAKATFTGLSAWEAELEAGDFLAGLPWDAPLVDPDQMNPETFLNAFD